MSLNYQKLQKHPRNFRDITGLKVEEFEKVVEKVRPEWKKRRRKRNRPLSKLVIGEKLV